MEVFTSDINRELLRLVTDLTSIPSDRVPCCLSASLHVARMREMERVNENFNGFEKKDEHVLSVFKFMRRHLLDIWLLACVRQQ